MRNQRFVGIAVFLAGVLLLAFIVYKQKFPAGGEPPETTFMHNMDRVGDHWERTVRGEVKGYVRDDPRPPEGTPSDSFLLDSDEPSNEQYPITGSLLELRGLEGRYVEMKLYFPLNYDGGREREIVRMKVLDDNQ